eukprot:UN00215
MLSSIEYPSWSLHRTLLTDSILLNHSTLIDLAYYKIALKYQGAIPGTALPVCLLRSFEYCELPCRTISNRLTRSIAH